MSSVQIGSYTLDTLQIYFAWDDDLYTHLKERGFGQGGFQRKTLPIIYSDNCESTTGVNERRRKYVIHPRYFGKTHEELGWSQTNRETEPIIPSEKPKMNVWLTQDHTNLKFQIVPTVDESEQYHIEYSTMAAFGRLYTNWAIPVVTMNDFKDIISRLQKLLSLPTMDMIDAQILTEKKQAQRELMYYVKVPITSYKFSIGEFLYAKEFLALNGVSGKLPSLIFKNEPDYLERLEPVLKVGFVHTREEEGFEKRNPQCALKVAQPKTTISLRGKNSKAKGVIVVEEPYENYFIVPARIFTRHGWAIVNKFSS